MKTIKLEQFDYAFRFAGLKDIGRLRESNQDEVLLCPEIGFFAVSDGMGGLSGGALASEFVGKSMPELMRIGVSEFSEHQSIGEAAKAFRKLAMTDELMEKVMDSLSRAMESEQWKKDGGQYIPYPATWINQRRWEDGS